MFKMSGLLRHVADVSEILFFFHAARVSKSIGRASHHFCLLHIKALIPALRELMSSALEALN